MINRQIIFSDDDDIDLHFLHHFVIKKCPNNFPQPQEEGNYPYFIDFKSEIVGEKFGILEHNYDYFKRPKIDDFKKNLIPTDIAQFDENKRTLDELIFLINAISDKYIFQYGSNSSWFVKLDKDGEVNTYFGMEGYKGPDFDSKIKDFDNIIDYELKEKQILELRFKEKKFNKSFTLTDLFQIYFSSQENKTKKEYLNACVILSKAYQLKKIDFSASFVFLISAIETLIEIEHKNEKISTCDYCKMPHYAVRQKFLKFLEKYGTEVDKLTINQFSEMRNRIVHKGRLLGMSYTSRFSIETQEDLDISYDSIIARIHYTSLNHLVKTCFRTFLLNNL